MRNAEPRKQIELADVARVHISLLGAADQLAELLVTAADLHRRVVDLHVDVSEAVVELERLLRDADSGHEDDASDPA